jgi:hypothetical protein
MRRTHEVVESVPHERAMDLEQPRGCAQPHHGRPFSCCSTALEACKPRFDPVRRLAQLIDLREELLDLGLACEIAAFLLQVFGEVLAGGAAEPPHPGKSRLRDERQPASGQVADEAREFLLPIGRASARSSR